ncbi:MAG: type II secretion system protein GspL, partial [Pseudomonadales bacterium]|nr:type II secretion system protein GspL [Pseudomonadales bacterium]
PKKEYNFLQGKFAASGRRKPGAFNWKPIAALVALFVILHTTFLYTHAWQINKEADRIDAETKVLYKKLFPRDKRIVNVKRQMEQHIRSAQQAGGSQGFMALLALTGEQIHRMNREQVDAITPRRVAYDDGQGDLRLDLVIKDFSQLEEFKSRLQQASLAVETASATQDKGLVKARLKIRSERS